MKQGGHFFAVFAFAGLILFASFGLVLQSFFAAYSRVEEPVVLGITSTPTPSSLVCMTEKEYLKKLAIYRPEAVLVNKTEKRSLSAEAVLQCRKKIVKDAGNFQDCPAYSVSIDASCLEKAIAGNIRFSEPREFLRNNKSGITVEARISDEKIDYSNLAVNAAKLFEQESSSKAIEGTYAIMKNVQVEAPVIKNAPNTDGGVAERYIEFDGSRQVAYLWNKKSFVQIPMSGAFSEYNPVGVYEILNKSPLAWSSTANKWMPYWQAFTFDKEQNAMLGIHALVYWYPGFEKSGEKKIFEPESHIGTPRSTGCLRFTLKDAKRLYETLKIGDMVVVHD